MWRLICAGSNFRGFLYDHTKQANVNKNYRKNYFHALL